jgi:heptosyltransferase-3
MFKVLPDPIDAGLVRRALVTKLRHHGDVLLTSPVFTVLKRALPAAEIDALIYRETAPMLEGHPAISRIHAIDRDAKKSGIITHVRAERGLLSALRARQYDLVVHLTEHPRGIWLARLLRPRYSVAREIDRAHWLWRKSFTHYYRLPRSTPRHTVECNLDGLRRIGMQPTPAEKALVLVPGDAATRRARALLEQHGVQPQRFIHLHPGSRWLFKCWPVERYAQFADRLAQDGWRIVVTGAPDSRERDLVDAIVAQTALSTRASLVDLTGELTLRELAAVTREARAFVGVDSAPMHIAAAMQTPVVALFGPSGEIEWGPWAVPHRIIASNKHPCRPCGIDGCGGGKISECLTTLPVERVCSALSELIGHAGAGGAGGAGGAARVTASRN